MVEKTQAKRGLITCPNHTASNEGNRDLKLQFLPSSGEGGRLITSLIGLVVNKQNHPHCQDLWSYSDACWLGQPTGQVSNNPKKQITLLLDRILLLLPFHPIISFFFKQLIFFLVTMTSPFSPVVIRTIKFLIPHFPNPVNYQENNF